MCTFQRYVQIRRLMILTGNHYQFQADWFNAWLSCLSCGMKLASITSQEEQDIVEQLISEHGNDILPKLMNRFQDLTLKTILKA